MWFTFSVKVYYWLSTYGSFNIKDLSVNGNSVAQFDFYGKNLLESRKILMKKPMEMLFELRGLKHSQI